MDRVGVNVLLLFAVINDHRELDHVFGLELLRVDEGNDIALILRRRRQIEYKARVEVFDHLHAEAARRMVALVDYNDRVQRANDLNERSLVRIRQQDGLILHQLREQGKIAVFLIRFAAFLILRAEGIVTENEYGKLLGDSRRVEVLTVQELRLGIDLHSAAEIGVDPLAVRVLGIAQRGIGLRQYRIGGHEPNHGLCRLGGHGVVYHLYRIGCNKRLTAAGRHLEAHARHTVQRILIIRHSAQTDVDEFLLPQCGVCFGRRTLLGQQIEEVGKVGKDVLLVGFQLHFRSS